jgi:hypothetical protein
VTVFAPKWVEFRKATIDHGYISVELEACADGKWYVMVESYQYGNMRRHGSGQEDCLANAMLAAEKYYVWNKDKL